MDARKGNLMRDRRTGGAFRFDRSFRNDWSRPAVPLVLTLFVLLTAALVAYS